MLTVFLGRNAPRRRRRKRRKEEEKEAVDVGSLLVTFMEVLQVWLLLDEALMLELMS